MGRPPGSKNKATATKADVTVMTPDDFDEGVPNDEGGEEQEQQAPPASPDDDVPTQGQLAKAIQAMVDSAPVKRIPWAKFKTRSPFNPTGKRGRKLVCRCYQNGSFVEVKKVNDEEIALLNRLGKEIPLNTSYAAVNGLVTVLRLQNGGNTDLHIRYKNKTIDDRMANKSEWRNFADLLKRCLDDLPRTV